MSLPMKTPIAAISPRTAARIRVKSGENSPNNACAQNTCGPDVVDAAPLTVTPAQ